MRERAADHRVAEYAGADQRVADRSRAVVAGVEQPAVAATPLVGLADDLVRRDEDRSHGFRSAARDRSEAVAAEHRGLAGDGRSLRDRQRGDLRPVAAAVAVAVAVP